MGSATFEKLDFSLMFLGGGSRFKSAEIAPFARFGVNRAGIDPIET